MGPEGSSCLVVGPGRNGDDLKLSSLRGVQGVPLEGGRWLGGVFGFRYGRAPTLQSLIEEYFWLLSCLQRQCKGGLELPCQSKALGKTSNEGGGGHRFRYLDSGWASEDAQGCVNSGPNLNTFI